MVAKFPIYVFSKFFYHLHPLQLYINLLDFTIWPPSVSKKTHTDEDMLFFFSFFFVTELHQNLILQLFYFWRRPATILCFNNNNNNKKSSLTKHSGVGYMEPRKNFSSRQLVYVLSRSKYYLSSKHAWNGYGIELNPTFRCFIYALYINPYQTFRCFDLTPTTNKVITS